ncbi:MAG: right-handed parallel beta-helix repeat-containing protein, partial [Planctomycetota bacterium]
MSTPLALTAAVLALAAGAHGEVLFVDDDCAGPGSGSESDPYCSIQTAIDNAVDGGEIVVAPGTYYETIDFLGKAVWLHSSDGPDVTIIDGTANFHVVQCVSGEGPDTVLEGFTITGGIANGNYPHHTGGGMYNSGTSPTISNCIFSNNASGGGGGMANINGSPTVTDCTFQGNSARWGGAGGMYNESSNPTVTDCTFSGNTSSGNDEGCGGMYNESSNPTVTNCVFSGNAAHGDVKSSGGMLNDDGSNPTVTNCTFSGNGGFVG